MTQPPPCAWCGAPSTGRREIEPAKHDKDGELVKPAKAVDVCDQHAALIERDTRIAELRSTIRRNDSMATNGPSDRARSAARERAEAARRELAQIENRVAA